MAGVVAHMVGLNAAAGGGVTVAQGRLYFRSVGAEATGTAAVVPGLPAGWQEDDILILFVNSANEAIATPGGWTEVSASPQGTGTGATAGAVRLGVFWKRATSGEVAPTVADTGNHTYAVIAAYVDCVDSGDPVDVSAGDTVSSPSSAVTWPTITTTVDDAQIVTLISTGQDAAIGALLPVTITNANLVDPEVRFDDGSVSSFGGSLSIGDGMKVALGATGTTTATLQNTATQARIVLALKPRVSDLPYVASVGATAGGGGDVSPQLPPGWQENDIFLLVVESANQAASAPAGYASVTNSPQGTGSAGVAGGTRLSVFWKRATSSESAPTVADTGDNTFAAILALRGCLTSGDPWEASAGDVASSASTSVTFPAVTTLGADRLIVNIVAHDIDAAGVSQASAWANSTLRFLVPLLDDTTSSGSGGGLAVAVGAMDSAGSTGTTTATLASSVTQGRITLAFPPA